MATTQSLLRFAPLPPRLTRSSLSSAINLPFPSSPVRSLTLHPPPRVPPIPASYNSTVPAVDRTISLLAYIHPFLSVLPYGGLLQSRLPFVASLTAPFSPVLVAYQRDPFVGFLVFIILYLLSLNPKMSLYVRFNADQAVGLDVVLIWLDIVHKLLGNPTDAIGVRLLEYRNGMTFALGCLMFFRAVLSCVEGRYTHLLPRSFSSFDIDEELQGPCRRGRNHKELIMRILKLIISAFFCFLSFIV